MAQFIRNFVNGDVLQSLIQVSQVSYHDERVFTIDWDPNTYRVVVEEVRNQMFYLTSPDIYNLTMRQVLEGLGYVNEQIVVTYASNNNIDEVLETQVQYAPLNQISLYGPNQQIPHTHIHRQLPMLPNPNDEQN